MKFFSSIYRFLLIVACLASFFWLLNKNLVPSGTLLLKKDFCAESRFISYLYPENRVGVVEEEDNGCFQRIFVEPAYFSVNVPRTFTRAKVKVIYANPDQEIFQLGLMKKRINLLDWNFQLKPLENKILDELGWFKLTEQGIILWQKQKRFESIYDYVNNLPIDQKTATFYYYFSPEAVGDPTKVVGWNPETSLEDVDYLIADYLTPEVIGRSLVDGAVWQEQIAEFSAGAEYMNDRNLEFMFSAPGLTESRHEIKIKSIEVELSRAKTDWSNLLSDLKSYLFRRFDRLKSKI